MAKQEIGWKKTLEDGTRLQVKVHLFGGDWQFSVREKRFDCWERVPEPELADWLELLENVERRVVRRLYTPADADKLRSLIKEKFPGTKC